MADVFLSKLYYVYSVRTMYRYVYTCTFFHAFEPTKYFKNLNRHFKTL